MEKVEWHDVQGIVSSGYPKLPYSAYVLWRLRDGSGAQAKAWLGDLAPRLMRVGSHDDRHAAAHARNGAMPRSLRELKQANGSGMRAVNLALTATAFTKLNVAGDELATFSSEFLEGMAPAPEPRDAVPRRSNLLGDVGSSSPEHWEWGGWNGGNDIDGMLMLYADSPVALDSLLNEEVGLMQPAAEPVGRLMHGRILEGNKEHFGYSDGLSQPLIEGSPAAKARSPRDQHINVVKPGEFVLGYENERGFRVTAPRGSRGKRNLWRNGTYLVFRHLEQDVRAFEEFVGTVCRQVFGRADPKSKDWVTSKLLGREQSGKPLMHAHANKQTNDFLYHFDDRAGFGCPIGAHIRRANPRDSMAGTTDPDTALRLSKMHRIIRRGRPYGEPLNGAAAAPEEGTRGMHFICLNADIAGQFEMIQHSWLNNPHFGGLQAGTDPLSHYPDTGGVVTIPSRPVNIHVERQRPFVRVRGGAYFFLPGIKAVEALAAS